ncbi:MAG: phosphoethanolamine--lipid A transferase [Propionivibrio sp.]
MTSASAALGHWRRWTPALRVETLALFAGLFFTLSSNGLFWRAAFAERDFAGAGDWLFAAGLFVTLTALHFLILLVLCNRWTAKPLLAVILIATAFASYYMASYTVFLDPSMLRNVLRTDVKEAGELFSLGMLPHLVLYGLLPLLLLTRVRVVRDAWRPALLRRALSLVLGVLILGGALVAIFQDMAPLMRNNKEVRYLITPANYLYSLARVLGSDASAATRERQQIGLDATLAPSWQTRKKPTLFVVVVGETARAANWGLSGYARQTTPQLAERDVINFAQVTSCGTNTEVSLPCMFSLQGRRNYDEDKIRGSESLLNVLERAGLRVLWRDNQSGCKGVCTGVETQKLDSAKVPGLCDGERCFDEILTHDLDQVLADRQGNLVIVMHQLGNHGPAYYKRYPEAFRRYTPECETPDLAKCERETVVNAYDNAILYTDHVLAKTIDFLKAKSATYDTAMLYVSDHGESLGENGLYLHGVPYSIAPKVQVEVPMTLWVSPGYAQSFALDTDCLRQRAAQPATHDNLFHSLLGMLDVRTSIYDAGLDVAAQCRR